MSSKVQVNVKSSLVLTILECISKRRPGLSRSEVVNEAIFASASAPVDWKSIAEKAEKLRDKKVEGEPEYIQISIRDRETWVQVLEKIKQSFSPRLSRIHASIAVKWVLTLYMTTLNIEEEILQAEEITASKPETTTENHNLETILGEILSELQEIKVMLGGNRE